LAGWWHGGGVKDQVTRTKLAKVTAAIGAMALLALVVGASTVAAATGVPPCQADDDQAPRFCYAKVPLAPLPAGAPRLTRDSYSASNQSSGQCPAISTVQRRLINKQFKKTHKGVRTVFSDWPVTGYFAWSIGTVYYYDAGGRLHTVSYRFRDLCPIADPHTGPPGDLPWPNGQPY
jgi:hypothetical protein